LRFVTKKRFFYKNFSQTCAKPLPAAKTKPSAAVRPCGRRFAESVRMTKKRPSAFFLSLPFVCPVLFFKDGARFRLLLSRDQINFYLKAVG